jgi:DNA invertase Pin-like site-specific DNA recombinase
MGKHYKTTAAQRAEIVRRYNAGESLNAIARVFKITGGSVNHYARKAGMPRRRMPAARKLKPVKGGRPLTA